MSEEQDWADREADVMRLTVQLEDAETRCARIRNAALDEVVSRLDSAISRARNIGAFSWIVAAGIMNDVRKEVIDLKTPEPK